MTFERNGNVRRLPDPVDGRALCIELTKAGRKVVDRTMQVLLERFTERLGDGFSTAQALTVASASAQYRVRGRRVVTTAQPALRRTRPHLRT